MAPDLLVYFGDLGWRSVGAVGNPSVYTFENDIGPDGANHDRTGVFAMKGSPGPADRQGRGTQPRRRRSDDPLAVRDRGRTTATSRSFL